MKVVEPYVQSATIFPDSMYLLYDWSQFEHSEAAHRPIDWNSPDFHLLNASVFYHTNRFRLKMKKPQLIFSDALRNAALYHGIQMSERRFFGHINPFDKKMRTPEHRIKTFGIHAEAYAENITKEYIMNYTEGKYFDRDSAGWYYTGKNKEYLPALSYYELGSRIVQTWIDSKEHRETMLESRLLYLGCAVVPDQSSWNNRSLPKVIAVQNFSGMIFSDWYNLR